MPGRRWLRGPDLEAEGQFEVGYHLNEVLIGTSGSRFPDD